MAETRIYGIRHHGPGSARALRDALEGFEPDAVLIEGPPEADGIIGLAGDPAMVPPVALLAHVPGGRGGVAAGEGAPDGTPARAGTPSSGTEPGGAPERRAAFWPFAEFSPEWQAIRYAIGAGITVRFCDLPAAHQLADEPGAVVPPGEAGGEPPGGCPEGDGPGGGAHGPEIPSTPESRFQPQPQPESGADRTTDPDQGSEASGIRLDPLGTLAAAAGYDDAERWWDDVMEHRYTGRAASAGAESGPEPGGSPFAAIAEAMAALREQAPPMPPAERLREQRREAYMRRTLRRALRDGHQRVAVVCGAWHVPAIEAALKPSRAGSGPGITAGQDDRTLRGLPRAKVEITWVPWTHGRLADRSGYGAGVRSPGWYHHLFTSGDRPIERWLAQAARVLREEDLPVSPANVIEAVRLAEALAALRGRPLAGLDEVTEAARAVLCEGAELPLALIQRRMVIGERLGGVPSNTPMVPLQRDLRAEQRRLRLRPSAARADLDLDLRKPTDLDRSRLLHRLGLLDIGWGEAATGGRASRGTFRESWTLAWRPEFDVETIEASVWGTTVLAAATARARASALEAGELPAVTELVERCLLADLPGALPEVMRGLADLAAADTDLAHLMAALPALVRALRYGDVRGTATRSLRTVVDGLVIRVCVGLPAAISGVDDNAARRLLGHIDQVHGALALLGGTAEAAAGTAAGADAVTGTNTGAPAGAGPGAPEPGGDTDRARAGGVGHLARWYDTLAAIVDGHGMPGPGGPHGLLEGRITRLLFDAGRLDADRSDADRPDADRPDAVRPDDLPGGISTRMARAVSPGLPSARAAAWIEGFLGGAGGGLVLVHDQTLLRLVDAWIGGLSTEQFTDVLPLLRRTFAGFEPPERRSIGERVRRLGEAGDDHGASHGAPHSAPRRESLDLGRAAAAEETVRRILGWEATR